MFSASLIPTLSKYIDQFIKKAKDPQSGLTQIEIPASLKTHTNELGLKFKTSFGQGARTHISVCYDFGCVVGRNESA